MRRNYLFLGALLLATFDIHPGRAQTIQVSPSSMTFTDLQPVGSPIPGRLQVIITNNSAQTVDLVSETVTGDFFFDTDPPSQSLSFGSFGTLLPGGAMGFALLFNAAAAGPRTGTFTLVDNAQGSPQAFALSGTGIVGPLIQPRNAKLDLVAEILGTPISQVEEIVAVGNQTVAIDSVNISGTGFSQTSNCGGAMTQGQTCQITVVFNPSVAGPETGTLTVANTGATNPLTIPLTGDAGDFAFFTDPNSPTSATITAGKQATFPFFVTGFLGSQGLAAITFSCSGLPPGASCRTIQLGPNLPEGALPAELIVSTTPRDSASLHRTPGWGWTGAVVAIALLARRRKRGMRIFMITVAACAMLATLVSCGGSSGSGGTPAGTFSLTVTGVRNGLAHSFPVTLTVR